MLRLTVLVLITALSSAANAVAQPSANAASPSEPTAPGALMSFVQSAAGDSLPTDREIERLERAARKRKNVGTVLVVAGLVGGVAAAFYLKQGVDEGDRAEEQDNPFAGIGSGLSIAIGLGILQHSVAALITGAVVIGSGSRYNRLADERRHMFQVGQVGDGYGALLSGSF